MDNQIIASHLQKIADLLEILDENIYKVRAYQNAARNIQELSKDIDTLIEEGELESISGIGESIGKKVRELVETGELSYLKKLSKQIPISITSLMEVEGIGGKTAKKLYDELGIKTIDDLWKAAESGDLVKISGFTERKVENIKTSIKNLKSTRMSMPKYLPIAINVKKFLEKLELLSEVHIAGSIRRKRSTIHDLDMIAVGDEGVFEEVMEKFEQSAMVEISVVKGESKITATLTAGLNVDIRFFPEKLLGSGLLYLTGSKEHGIALRKLAEKKNMLLNEYGLHSKDKSKLIASKTEEEIYKALGLSYIPPELREDRGEIEAVQNNNLPKLIELEDLQSDIHLHTDMTDGKSSVKEILEASAKKGYEFIVMTDHGGEMSIDNPLDEKRFFEQRKEIEKVVEDLDLTVLHGLEGNITKKGTIDIPNSLLKECDFVVASLHSYFDLPEKEMNQRVLTALDNEYVNAIGHPTGRYLGKRKGVSLNFSKIAKKCQENNVALEINSQPHRLDLDDYNVYPLKDKVDIYISTDAHDVKHLDYMQWGINIARRAWCEKEDILNTLSLKEFKKRFKIK
jgi:DNA polymerase (family 10)